MFPSRTMQAGLLLRQVGIDRPAAHAPADGHKDGCDRTGAVAPCPPDGTGQQSSDRWLRRVGFQKRCIEKVPLRANNMRVVKTYYVIIALDLLQSDVQDAETGQRGYLLTGNERYLEPFQAAKLQITSRMAGVEAAIADNAIQRRRLMDLKSQIATKIDELNRTVTLRQSGDADGALAVVNSDLGKRHCPRSSCSDGCLARKSARNGNGHTS